MSGDDVRASMADLDASEVSELLVDGRKERIADVVSKRTRTLTVVLDRLEDSFNMAAVLRTCEGHGLQELHVIEHPEHPFAPHPKITQGCDKWVDVHVWSDFQTCARHLRERGFRLWASALGEQSRPLRELTFDQPMALIFGNERKGVSPEALAEADGRFWIPMRGFVQSFNISVAVACTLTRAIMWREDRLGLTGDLTSDEAAELKDRFHRLSLKQRGKLFAWRAN